VLVAGRMTMRDFISYVIAQVLAQLPEQLCFTLSSPANRLVGPEGLGQNGGGPGYLGQYNLLSAFIFEVVATFLFLVCILGVTQTGGATQFAGLAIGLTLVAIILSGST